MATTNLISKSLGDILTESGNGAPDHTSPLGSLYTDKDTGLLWQNSDGSTTWFSLQTVAYCEGYYQDNTTATSIITFDTWASVTNNITEGASVGVSANTSTLVVEDGYDGTYEVRGDVTIGYVAGTNNYEVGLSVNSVDPVAGTYSGSHIDSVKTRQHIGFETIVDLVGGDTLSLAVRTKSGTSTDNVIIRHAQLFMRKVN